MCDFCFDKEDKGYKDYCHESLRGNCHPVDYIEWKYGKEAIEKAIEDSLKR